MPCLPIILPGVEPAEALDICRALLSHLRWRVERIPLSARDRIVVKTSVAFDVSIWEVLMPLAATAVAAAATATAVQIVCPWNMEREGEQLLRFCVAAAATFVHFVPSQFSALVGGAVADCCGSGGELVAPFAVQCRLVP